MNGKLKIWTFFLMEAPGLSAVGLILCWAPGKAGDGAVYLTKNVAVPEFIEVAGLLWPKIFTLWLSWSRGKITLLGDTGSTGVFLDVGTSGVLGGDGIGCTLSVSQMTMTDHVLDHRDKSWVRAHSSLPLGKQRGAFLIPSLGRGLACWQIQGSPQRHAWRGCKRTTSSTAPGPPPADPEPFFC